MLIEMLAITRGEEIMNTVVPERLRVPLEHLAIPVPRKGNDLCQNDTGNNQSDFSVSQSHAE